MFAFLEKYRTPSKSPVEAAPLEVVEFAEQYTALARKIGVGVAIQTTQSPLVAVLQDLGIGAYDREKVERYLDRKGRWGWYPMRVRDFHTNIRIERRTQNNFPTLYGGRGSMYGAPIPYPVLVTADQIIERLPDAAFFVAAISTDPDPFLAVVEPSHPAEVFIIERWDEPSFRG